MKLRSSRPSDMPRLNRYGAPLANVESVGPSAVTNGVWNSRATQSAPTWKYSTPTTANTLSSLMRAVQARCWSCRSVTLYFSKTSFTSRPLIGTTRSRFH